VEVERGLGVCGGWVGGGVRALGQGERLVSYKRGGSYNNF
jgi:hypothetical protein